MLFATFAEAVAEGRGRARAESLKRARSDTMARLMTNPANRAKTTAVPATSLKRGDLVLVEAGDLVPSDGEIIEGVASVNESAITGESAPVVREAGGDRSAVTGGTQVVSDWLVVRITADAGNTFLDRMIALVEGAERRKTPNEIALNILLAGLTLIFLIAVATLVGFGKYSSAQLTIPVLAALLVCLIPTTIGGLLSAIGIAGMDRLVRFNVVATSGRAVEAAGDVDALLLDKTGTITFGNRMASGFYPASGVQERDLAEACALASLGDDTPEGRSILALARDRYTSGPGHARSGADHPVQCQHPHVRHRFRRPQLPQGRCGLRPEGAERHRRRRLHRGRRAHRPRRLHAAGGQRQRPPARRHRAEGHRQARHQGAFRFLAQHGHPYRDGDR